MPAPSDLDPGSDPYAGDGSGLQIISPPTPVDGGLDGLSAPRLGDAQVDAILDGLQRSGASSTAALIEALKQLEAFGFSAEEAALMGMGLFPVAGRATYRDDFHDPRLTPAFHLHQGNDIFAPFDTPVKSPATGVLRYADEAVGGKAAYVTTPDRTFYYMAHLSRFAPDLSSGVTVEAGQVVGFNGDSGNARGGPPHVHFEIHPLGGAAVNPKPFLDNWLNDAMANVDAVIATYRDTHPQILVATGVTRQFDVRSFEGSPVPSLDTLLWASTVTPAGGGLQLAERHLAQAAERIDWRRHTAVAEARVVVKERAAKMASTVLVPLTPPALAVQLLGVKAAGWAPRSQTAPRAPASVEFDGRELPQLHE